jgi:hypothetical protein
MRRLNCGESRETAMTQMSADIMFDTEPTPEQEALAVKALAALGASGRIRVLPLQRGLEDLPWLILLTLPLQAFRTTMGGKLAEDAYQGFQNIVRKLLHTEHAAQLAAPRPLVLQDAASGLRIVLDRDLSADGYKQLLTLDLTKFRSGPVHYDRAGQCWRSEIDEAKADRT